MKNHLVLAACLVLAASVSGQQRSEQRVAARVAEQKALSAFTRSAPFAPAGASTLRNALVGPVVADATFMMASRTALAGMLAQPAEHLTLEIPTAEGVLELDLVRAEMYATGFSVVAASTGAALEQMPGLHYRGIIAGAPGTLAAISIFPDEVMGFVSDATGNHVLGKLEGSSDEHIYYAERDLIDPPVFECHTSDAGDVRPTRPPTGQDQARTARCVDLYWEVDHDIFVDKGGLTNTTNYITGLFNQHATLFDNDGISVQLSELFIWDVPSPYTGTTTEDLLDQFRAFRNGFNGDVADLLSYAVGGGLAVFDGLCASNPDNSMCYSGIYDSYASVPVYSSSVLVVAHEEGHVMGSPHTHACAWNGNDTAIDGCGPVEGYPYEGTCSGAPIPPNGGTIMSYCHLNDVGTNFNLGFGPQPTALLVGNVDAAPCVGTCGAVGCDMPLDLTSDALANSATVGWTAASDAITYTLQWKPSTTAMWITVAGITATDHDLTPLFPAVTYSYRVRTECDGGSSAYSPVHTFTTPCTLGALCDDGDPFTESDIIVSDCVCAGTPPTPFQQIDKVVASDRASSARFGSSVAISGDYAIVGAPSATEDPEEPYAGAAYIFVRSGSAWVQQQKLIANDASTGHDLGLSVAISGDYAIVGAQGVGFDATGTNYVNGAGAAYIFVRNGNTWSQQQKIVASDRGALDHFGGSVAISGDHAIVGAKDEDHNAAGVNEWSSSGSAYIFVRNGDTWTQQQKIVASDRYEFDQFGACVAMSGNDVVVTAPNCDVGAYYSLGAAYIFVRNGSTWSQQDKIWHTDRISGDQFGVSVAISGDHVIVGVPKKDEIWDQDYAIGAAYTFVRSGSNWTQEQKLVASDREYFDRFGVSVAISGNRAIVGAHQEDHDATGGTPLAEAGSAYTFVRGDNAWVQLQKIVASDRATMDEFGVSVAMDGDHALVGAYMEDEDEFGNNTLYDAGSVYFLTNDTALVELSTALDPTHTTTDLLVFPVPTSDVLTVLLPDTRAYHADVIGLDGRSVLPVGTIRSNTPVAVSTLASGVYLLRITSATHEVRYVRFVKE